MKQNFSHEVSIRVGQYHYQPIPKSQQLHNTEVHCSLIGHVISICPGTASCGSHAETWLTEKPLSGTFWSLCLRKSKLHKGSQHHCSSLEVTVLASLSQEQVRGPFPTHHKRAKKHCPSGAESWIESACLTHCRCYLESFCILEGKKKSFKILCSSDSCLLHIPVHMRTILNMIRCVCQRKFGKQEHRFLRWLCSTFHSAHSSQTSVLSFLYAIMQRSTECQAGSSEPAHSLTVFWRDSPRRSTTHCDRRIRYPKSQNRTHPSCVVQETSQRKLNVLQGGGHNTFSAFLFHLLPQAWFVIFI